MGNLNFQDEKSDQEHQVVHSQPEREEEKVEDIFVDEPTSGMKILWVVIAVIVVAGVAGGLYFLNSKGYLNFGKKAVVSETTQAASTSTQAADTSTSGAATDASFTSPAGGRYSLQVSAFRSKGQANRYLAQLRTKGIDGYIAAGSVRNGRQWFKVCVGSYPNRIQAIAAIEGMKKKVGTDVWVVPAE